MKPKLFAPVSPAYLGVRLRKFFIMSLESIGKIPLEDAAYSFKDQDRPEPFLLLSLSSDVKTLWQHDR